MTTITGADQNVTLLGTKLSPFVIRARLALSLKGITYDFLEEVFGTKSELLLKSNPVYKKVPVLIHKGKTVCESMNIVEYIDDVWVKTGPSILPSDPYERATARFWVTYIDDKIFPLIQKSIKAITEEEKAEAISQFNTALQPLETAFEKCSNGKAFFGGDDIGFVDIALGCFVPWILTAKIFCGSDVMDEKKIPNLVKWAERMESHYVAKEVVPEIDEFVQFGRVLQAMWNNQATN